MDRPRVDLLLVKFFAEAKKMRHSDASLSLAVGYGMAERVGFAPLPVVENKELKGFLLAHDPLDTHESLGRDTY